MTAPIKRVSWTASIAVKALVGCAAYAWLVGGNTYAGNALQFLVWLCLALTLLMCMTDPTNASVPVPTAAQYVFNGAFSASLLAAFAAFGHFSVATAYVLMILFSSGYRARYYDAAGQRKRGAA